MKKIHILFVLLLCLFSCEEIYYPDENAYRDPDVIGTWQGVPFDNDDALLVFTEQGYYDYVNYINNDNYTGYTGLAGIWEVSEKIDSSTNIGQLHTKCTTKNFTTKGWEYYEDYYFSSNKDTLYIGLNLDNFEAYTKYHLQLIYEDTGWIGIDSTNQQ